MIPWYSVMHSHTDIRILSIGERTTGGDLRLEAKFKIGSQEYRIGFFLADTDLLLI